MAIVMLVEHSFSPGISTMSTNQGCHPAGASSKPFAIEGDLVDARLMFRDQLALRDTQPVAAACTTSPHK